MDVKTGKIFNLPESLKDEFFKNSSEDENVGKRLVKVKESDMTEKQKENQQVSPNDNKTKLGKMRIKKANKFRNKPCPCGSGKKFKKCCWNKEEIEVKYTEKDGKRYIQA